MFGAGVDFVHALFMAAWILGLPFLFVHRWPRLTKASGVYAIAFIVASRVSHHFLGECFFTTLARWCWRHPSAEGIASTVSNEWFTVRLAEAVFRMSPSHRTVTLASEALILVTAAGILLSIHRREALARTRHLDGPSRGQASSAEQ